MHIILHGTNIMGEYFKLKHTWFDTAETTGSVAETPLPLTLAVLI